jgi:hypothetical protein
MLLFEHGIIDRDQLTAGTGFNTRFRTAHLDQLHASDLAAHGRIHVSGGGTCHSPIGCLPGKALSCRYL